jgi:hypothetical protein
MQAIMPTVYSKFNLYILPTYEKVYRWYEGLDTDSESSEDDDDFPYFKQAACSIPWSLLKHRSPENVVPFSDDNIWLGI